MLWNDLNEIVISPTLRGSVKALRQRYNAFLEQQKKNNNETEINGAKVNWRRSNWKEIRVKLGITEWKY